MTNLEKIQDSLAEDALKLDNLDEAIIGVTQGGYVVYSYDKIIEKLVEWELVESDAQEWYDYNILGLEGNGNWVIVYELED